MSIPTERDPVRVTFSRLATALLVMFLLALPIAISRSGLPWDNQLAGLRLCDGITLGILVVAHFVMRWRLARANAPWLSTARVFAYWALWFAGVVGVLLVSGRVRAPIRKESGHDYAAVGQMAAPAMLFWAMFVLVFIAPLVLALALRRRAAGDHHPGEARL